MSIYRELAQFKIQVDPSFEPEMPITAIFLRKKKICLTRLQQRYIVQHGLRPIIDVGQYFGTKSIHNTTKIQVSTKTEANNVAFKFQNFDFLTFCLFSKCLHIKKHNIRFVASAYYLIKGKLPYVQGNFKTFCFYKNLLTKLQQTRRA